MLLFQELDLEQRSAAITYYIERALLWDRLAPFEKEIEFHAPFLAQNALYFETAEEEQEALLAGQVDRMLIISLDDLPTRHNKYIMAKTFQELDCWDADRKAAMSLEDQEKEWETARLQAARISPMAKVRGRIFTKFAQLQPAPPLLNSKKAAV